MRKRRLKFRFMTDYQKHSTNFDLQSHQFSSVQSLSHVRLFATPWIAARQASLSITNSRSSPRLTSIESVMPSNHLILGRPLLLLPPIPPSIKVFSNESTLRMTWPKYWSFSFSVIPSKEIPGLIWVQLCNPIEVTKKKKKKSSKWFSRKESWESSRKREFQLSYFKSWKMMLWKCCTQYASKFGKLSSGHRTGNGQFSFQSQRKAMPKNDQTTAQLHSSHMLVK